MCVCVCACARPRAGLRSRKWTRPLEFKSWTRLFNIQITLMPCMNRIILRPAMNKLKGRLGYLIWVRQPVLEKEKSEKKTLFMYT